MSKYSRLLKGALASSAILVSSGASGQESCLSIDTTLTADRAVEYATLVSQAVEGVSPDAIGFLSFMESGGWSTVYVTTPETEPGYFFFEDLNGEKQFRDVWGGVAFISERPDLIQWADALGAPADLAACFAQQAASIEDE